MSEETKKALEQKLWSIANDLRGRMNADEFKHYILGLIFYKYLSEKIEGYALEVLGEEDEAFHNLTEEDHGEMIEEIEKLCISQLGYFLKPGEVFSAMAENKSGFILDNLRDVLKHIENSTLGTESEDDFEHLFDDMDLGSNKLGKTAEERNTTIVKILNSLSGIDFELENSEKDVLGDAYEYLIGKFAAGAGKSGGEFYTPQEVSTILSKIVTTGKTEIRSVYDCACGSGSLLLRVAKNFRDQTQFFGQELNPTTYNLARMNMIMHNVNYKDFDIKRGDTLEEPLHLGQKFEAIVANPPFSANWSASSLLLSDERYEDAGRLAPKGKADYAFIQHMVHHLDENGIMAVVLPHGVLFRGAAEGHIRKHLIKDKNYLDAVIGLPANIFYGTSIPSCIMVFRKDRKEDDDVLFVDASAHFEKGKNQNYLNEDHVEKIADIYSSRIEEEKFSHLASRAEIAENDYNLNIPRYVDTFEEEDPIDLGDVSGELNALEVEMDDADSEISSFCRELNISTPF